MNPYRKPRCDSRLKNLPPEQQARIIAWLDGPEGYAGAVRLAQEQLGLKTSVSPLSQFHSWWHLQRHLEQAACFAAAFEQTLITLPQLKLDHGQLSDATQLIFELQALKQRDLNTFCRLRQMRQADQGLRLDERKLALREAQQNPLPQKSPKKGGISTEVLAQIEKELNLM